MSEVQRIQEYEIKITIMEDIKRNIRRIDREFIKTVKTEMVNCNRLEVETGTNGYHGGDTGHGGRALVRLSAASSTDMRCNILGDIEGSIETYEVHFSHVDFVEIVVGGDAEIETLIDSLEFVVKNLKEQIKNKGEWPKNIQ